MDKNRPVEFIFAIKVYLSLDGKCLGFRRHLRAVYPARFLALPLASVIREKVRLTTTDFSHGKANKTHPEEATEMAVVSDKVKYRSDGSSFAKEKERGRKSSQVLSSLLITT